VNTEMYLHFNISNTRATVHHGKLPECRNVIYRVAQKVSQYD